MEREGSSSNPMPTGPAIINYGPLWMSFSDREWENSFQRHWNSQLLRADLWWCLFTMALVVDFYVKLGILDPHLLSHLLPDLLVYVAIAFVVSFLILRRPTLYVGIRTYLLFATRIHHQFVALNRLGIDLAPPDGTTFAAASLPLDTARGTMGRLLATCLLAAMVTNGYQLASHWQAANAGLNLVFSLVKNYRLCRTDVSPSFNVLRRSIHSAFTRWTDRMLGFALPLAAGGGADAAEVAPCAVFRLWALIVAGFLVPVVGANLLEEWSRLSFLAAKGCGVLSPSLTWRAVHAAVLVVLGARVVWEALTVAAFMFPEQ